MINQKWILISTVTISVVALLLLIAWFRFPAKDDLGRTPEVVVRAFVEAVNANNYELATSFWTQTDIANVEANTNLKFPDFCKEFIECDTFSLTPIAKQKGGAFLVQFEGVKTGKQKAFALYSKRVDGKWKLVMNRFMIK